MGDVEPELDHELMRWPSDDLHEDNRSIIERVRDPSVKEVWIGGDFPDSDCEEETKGSEEDEEDHTPTYKLPTKPVMLHREYASKDMGYFRKREPRVYELFDNGRLISFSSRDGTEVETIELSQVGLILQKGHKVKLHLEDPRLKGKDNRPLGHWDLKHVIWCKSLNAATIFKRKIYNETLHLHFGDE